MPVSRPRKGVQQKRDRAAQVERRAVEAEFGLNEPLPLWYKVIMFGLMIIGLLWIIVYYIAQGQAPVSAAGGWNIVIGFGFVLVGFLMTMRWR